MTGTKKGKKRALILFLFICILAAYCYAGFTGINVPFPEQFKGKGKITTEDDKRSIKRQAKGFFDFLKPRKKKTDQELIPVPEILESFTPSFKNWNYTEKYGVDLSLEMQQFWTEVFQNYLQRKKLQEEFELGEMIELEFMGKHDKLLKKGRQIAYNYCYKIIGKFKKNDSREGYRYTNRSLPFGKNDVCRTVCKGYNARGSFELFPWREVQCAFEDAQSDIRTEVQIRQEEQMSAARIQKMQQKQKRGEM